MNNSSIQNYAVIAVFSKGKTCIAALNFLLGGSQALLRKMISDVRYLLKTKTSLQFKTNALILTRDILATVALIMLDNA